MPRPFHVVLELLAVVVGIVAVAYIDVPPDVATHTLNESAVRVSMVVVVTSEVGCSGDLRDAPAYIADLDGCGGSSQAEADVQKCNERDHGSSSCGKLWRIGALAARHRV